jgi:predicted RNA-binding protein with TRAM domain
METIIEDEKTTKELIPPVREGDIIRNIEIINTGKKGDGVVKHDGYIIFIEDCKIGEKIDFKVTKVFKNMGLGVKIIDEDEE